MSTNRSLSIDVILRRLQDKHGDIVKLDIESYINITTHATFIDKDYGPWKALPSSVLSGRGHPQRAADNRGRKRRSNPEDIQKKIDVKHGGKIRMMLETYTSVNNKATFYEEGISEPFYAKPQDVIRGAGHPHNRYKKVSKSLRISAEEVQRRIDERFGTGLVVLIKDSYVDTQTKARFIDIEYGEWQSTSTAVMKGHGHPQRGLQRQKKTSSMSIDEVKERIYAVHGDTITLEESSYVRASKKAIFLDKKYGQFTTTPQRIYSGAKHPQRLARNKYDSPEEVQNKIDERHGPGKIKLVPESYESSKSRATFIDSTYGEWETQAKSVVAGHGHPNRFLKESKTETQVFQFVQSLISNAQQRVTFNQLDSSKSKKEMDIYCPDQKIGIEFHGLYWHSDAVKLDKQYHLNKRLEAESLGIFLIQIYEDEWIHHQSIVESIIRNKLSLNNEKVAARKCTIKAVDRQTAKEFNEANHIMGHHGSCKYVGLYYDMKLVALMGYKKSGEGVDISRYCTPLNLNVMGGLTKLINFVKKETNPEYITYFIDLRYGNGNSLLQAGFIKESEAIGFRWADTENRITHNRLQCRANMDERKLSEKEHAEELGWYKIYDAGQAKFVLKCK